MTTLAPSISMVDNRAASLSDGAFARLVAENQSAVCAVAYSTLRDRAASEEVAQEAFLIAWRKLPELSEPPKMPAWICGIARNLAKNARRQAARTEASDDLEAVPADDGGPLDDLLNAENEALVSRALARLSDTYREPLVLFYRQDHSIREVAAALDISEATAKQRLSRGREQLTESVRTTVERALGKTGPGAAFTAAVVAAAASLPKSAHAAPVAKSGSVGAMALLGGLLAIGSVVGGAWLYSSSSASTDVESGAPSASAVAHAGLPSASTDLRSKSTAPGPHFRPRARGRAAALPLKQPDEDNPIRPAVSQALSRRIDLELNEASPRDVLRLLAEVSNTPIVVKGAIGSDVTYQLRAVTVQQALDETLEQAGAVWRDVDVIRVYGGRSPAGPRLEGPAVDMVLDTADFAAVATTLGEALEMPVSIADALNPPPVTIQAKAQPAGVLFAKIVDDAGLHYEVVPGIEVAPDEEE
ncbi:MAG: sigma-70 family RNA polymerase sigma factor [Polyangiaceae bacterium]|nr:sigma-70 family RNA polymerase sigma factor [Polyangiaceae bacterium]